MGWTFEFDRAKSETNKAKHGIDFAEAQRLWADSDHLEIPARSTGEARQAEEALYASSGS